MTGHLIHTVAAAATGEITRLIIAPGDMRYLPTGAGEVVSSSQPLDVAVGLPVTVIGEPGRFRRLWGWDAPPSRAVTPYTAG